MEEEGGERSMEEVSFGHVGPLQILMMCEDLLATFVQPWHRQGMTLTMLVCALAWQAAGLSGVAAGSGGEAPDPASPCGVDNKRARTTISTRTSTDTSPGGTGCPLRPLITARHGSRTAVGSSPELLEHVLSFLAGGRREARKDLGRAALVCQLWREAAAADELWEVVVSDIMSAMAWRVLAVGARRCVLERTQCHRDLRVYVGDMWWWFLNLQVEVGDMLDETSLLSAEGQMLVTPHPHDLRFDHTHQVHMVNPAFSAASRDPVQRRFASIDDYFRRGPDTVEEAIYVKVYVRDHRTGRQALLWSTYGQGELRCEAVAPDDPMRPHLPEGSRRVTHADWMPTYSRGWSFMCGPRRARRGWRRRTGCGGWWRATASDNCPAFYLQFTEDVSEAQLASLTQSLLQP
jgi:hypothetical protein